MALSDSFVKVYDKAIKRGKGQSSSNQWVVVEHVATATMTRLEVNAVGDFLGFEQELVKNVADTTTRMSSVLENKDCDGVAFFIDHSEQEHLVFVELKSGFDVEKITGAYHQIIMSFIKMHAWLSLCKEYNLEDIKVHFIVACKCFDDDDDEVNVWHRISQAQQLGQDTFEAKFLKPLLQNNNIKVIMSGFGDIQKLPFHDSICEKEVHMYLVLTKTPSDSETSVTIKC